MERERLDQTENSDSGLALARPVLESRTLCALACYMDVATDYSALLASPLRGRPEGRLPTLHAAVRKRLD
jgi:hypothetical protein